MVRKLDDPQLIHFHIHWSRKKRLDWESFDSRHEATVRALECEPRRIVHDRGMHRNVYAVRAEGKVPELNAFFNLPPHWWAGTSAPKC